MKRVVSPDNSIFILLLAIIFFTSTAVFLNFVVPPFQNPDEPHHFGWIMAEMEGKETYYQAEQKILKMMDEHYWWRLVGMGQPESLPQRFREIKFIRGYSTSRYFRQEVSGMKFYHFLLGRFLRFLGIEDYWQAYYICRLFSVFFGLGTIIFVFLFSRLFNFSFSSIFPWGFFFILFLPQFLIHSVCVSSDLPAIFLGAVFFWGVASFLENTGKNYLIFAVIIVSAFLGFVTDRSTFTLIILALLIPFFQVKRRNYQETIIDLLIFIVGLLLLVFVFINLFPQVVESNIKMASSVYQKIPQAVSILFSFGERVITFLSFAADSFLARFGWAAFGPGLGFYYLWRAIVLGVIICLITWHFYWIYNFLSLIITVYRKRSYLPLKKRIKPALIIKILQGKGFHQSPASVEKTFFYDKAIKNKIEAFTKRKSKINYRFLILSIIAVIFQIIIVWSSLGFRNNLAQGRHFFPMLFPLAFIFWSGVYYLGNLFGEKIAKTFLGAFVLVEFLLFNYLVWSKMIPIFHLTIQSPNPGI